VDVELLKRPLAVAPTGVAPVKETDPPPVAASVKFPLVFNQRALFVDDKVVAVTLMAIPEGAADKIVKLADCI
jgi:hypothetical protein